MRVVPRNRKREVVGGKGGGTARALIVCAGVEGEDAEGAALLGIAEGGGFGLAQGAELAGAALR